MVRNLFEPEPVPVVIEARPGRKTRPLPEPSKLPYGLVRITVWRRHRDRHGVAYMGDCYINATDNWRHDRSEARLHGGDVVDWSFDGFNFDYFNRGYLQDPKHKPDDLVLLAQWALEQWAVDQGLIPKKGSTH